jgi:3-oxoacyl-[acyl-carrier-protein] synthase II
MPSVVITGFGVVSPLGHSVPGLARRFAAGERAASAADGTRIESIPLAAVAADRRVRIGRLDRISQLFLAASYLAVEDAALAIPPHDAERVGLSFGTGLGCLLSNAEFYERVVEQGSAAASPRLFASTVSSAAAGEVSIGLGIHGPNATSHMGLAAGLGALGYGVDLIQMGKADVVLAGGADANGPALVRALRDMRLLKGPEAARPFRDAVPGVWPSEGAAVAVLERAEKARSRRARVWGSVEGYAAGFEPTLTGRAPQRDGIAGTIRRALADAGCAPGTIGTLMVSAHGTPLDAVERAACEDVLGHIDGVRVLAPKQALGECFGASGPFAVALALGLPEQSADTAALVSAVCYSGSVCAMVVRRYVL